MNFFETTVTRQMFGYKCPSLSRTFYPLLSHPTNTVYQKWNFKLFEEMYVAFLHGRSEKSPVDGWYKVRRKIEYSVWSYSVVVWMVVLKAYEN